MRKPRKSLLVAGIIIYSIAFVLALAFSRTHQMATEAAISFLLFGPLGLAAIAILLGWTAFWIGTVTGTPLVAFTYGFSAMKRAWRSVVGCCLIASVLLAVFATLISR